MRLGAPFPMLVEWDSDEIRRYAQDVESCGIDFVTAEKEYQAAGQDVRRRGRRIDEQLQVLRLLWTDDRITFEGEFHQLDDVGLGRLPPTQPRIWLGATINDRSVPRMVTFGDGWIPGPEVDPTPHVPMLRQRLTDAGRDPSDFSINARIDLTTGDDVTRSSRAEHLLSGGTGRPRDHGPP